MFSFLQRIGKALMTPIAVLPVAALLLRFGAGDIFEGQSALVMEAAGKAVFDNLDMLFGIGIAYGLAKNSDGAAALSGALGVFIAKAVYLSIDENLKMGVFIGIIIGVVAGMLYNRFYNIKLPEFLGFFGGKRFVPIITSLCAVVIGIFAGYFWHYAQTGIDTFSHAIIGLDQFGVFLYGMLNRLLIPLGLHHILNSVFWFQLGEYNYVRDGVELMANGDLHRFFAGDKSAGTYMSGFYVTMMFGLPAMALAIYLKTDKKYQAKAGAILAGVAFTSFLTGITEPLEFLFIFIAPALFILHALLTGLALVMANLFDIHAGFGFSAGAIDYLINYKLAQNPLLIIPIGLIFGVIYFVSSYLLLSFLKTEFFKEKKSENNEQNSNTQAFIDALGGKENIVDVDACITRLRIKLKDNRYLNDDDFTKLGAAGVIRPDNNSIQIVLGSKSEGVASAIRDMLSK